MQQLAEEDPTFHTHTDPDTGQTIISGMGELHLEIIVDRLLRNLKSRPMGKPQVAYKETIKGETVAEGRFVRQTGARPAATSKSNFHRPSRTGFVFENKIVGGAIPKEFIPAVEAVSGSSHQRHPGDTRLLIFR